MLTNDYIKQLFPVFCMVLYRIHLRATRIIYNLPHNICSDDIMSAPHWNFIVLFYIKRLLVITYNIYHGNSIEPLNDLITKPETTHNLRKSLNVQVYRPRTEVGRSSFKHRAALSWNLLPDDIKNCSKPPAASPTNL